MKTFQKGMAKVLFYVISGALLLYAASRSLDFITSTLPAQDQLIGFLGLAATSGGMISWLLIFMHASDGSGQKVTAAIMIAIDLLGEIALFTFDTLYRTGESGMTSALTPGDTKNVVLGLSLLVGLNILATVTFHLVEPDNMKRMREAFVKDHLENEALKHIEKHGEEIARTLAPQLAEQWKDDFMARFSNLQSLGLGNVNKSKEEVRGLVPKYNVNLEQMRHDDGEPIYHDEPEGNKPFGVWKNITPVETTLEASSPVPLFRKNGTHHQ